MNVSLGYEVGESGRRTYIAISIDGLANFSSAEWKSEGGGSGGPWQREWRHAARAADGPC